MNVRFLAGLLATALATSGSAQTSSDALAKANLFLQAGQADQALTLLNSLPQSGEAHNLTCRVQLTLEHWDAASGECEQAVKMDGQNSVYHMWLGRALCENAARASLMSAFSLAKKGCAEFETAARLDPRNADALSRFGESSIPRHRV